MCVCLPRGIILILGTDRDTYCTKMLTMENEMRNTENKPLNPVGSVFLLWFLLIPFLFLSCALLCCLSLLSLLPCVAPFLLLFSLVPVLQDERDEQKEQRLCPVPEDGQRQAETHRHRHQAAAQPHRTAPHLTHAAWLADGPEAASQLDCFGQLMGGMLGGRGEWLFSSFGWSVRFIYSR